ncbi:MAG: carboxypeptidase regulatory-like domain-containing protein [Acidobacteria bacterium]|uniref:Carboxypeptidase regulatory-like domain-containing protein n=1 Tax=Paludibaculum fermentans TaxID=1473598 RepID=A0A7S7NWJ2_PALFE|nr:carboxypeptidase-like regulatory domain-containing protein [Paludibaculum fermentans]MBN9661259.1 carboxypeptidase regulatory-like domain-containing protein [Acidobacteriota bacterium]QOY91100.1 carboxypeptidase regulatory-like domain-containing protein [Paludibaculum fermentans]
MRSRFLALMALLVFAFPVLADPPMTSLKIEVKTYTEKPIDRASVIVKFSPGRNYVKLGKRTHTAWQMKTNQEGVAKIPPLPQGNILIQVIAKGYQTFGQTFEVNEAERTIEVKLNAPQPQVSAH